MIERNKLETLFNDYLKIDLFQDYGPNGLQIEGREKIEKMSFAVSATVESIEQSIEWGAHALCVHHGLFWNFHGVRPLLGPHGKRVSQLIRNQINLFAYHLPLDAHMEVGNASSLAKRMNLVNLAPFGDYKGSPLGVWGECKDAQGAEQFKKSLEKTLNHSVLHSEGEKKKILRVGIITGGARNEWDMALKDGLDAYITGEMSEHNWHDAKEAGIHMFAGGHNATEQFGIQELKNWIEKKNDQIETIFFPSDNPA